MCMELLREGGGQNNTNIIGIFFALPPTTCKNLGAMDQVCATAVKTPDPTVPQGNSRQNEVLRRVHKRHCGVYLVPKDHLIWESLLPCQETLQQYYGEAKMWGLLLTACTNSPTVRVSHLTMMWDASSLTQAFRWLQPSQDTDCNLTRDSSQNYLAKLLPNFCFIETV